MGLSNAISGGIIMFGITYVIFIFGGFTDTAASFTETSSQMSDLENKLLKTSIVIDIRNEQEGFPTFDIDVTNTNLEKLWEFDKFDVIATYEDESNDIHTETLTYSSTCPPAAGEWCVESWQSTDELDPEILNNGEEVRFAAEVSRDMDNNSWLTVAVSTQNGVVATHVEWVT